MTDNQQRPGATSESPQGERKPDREKNLKAVLKALKETKKQLRERLAELAMLLEVSESMASAIDRTKLADMIIDAATRYLPSDTASLFTTTNDEEYLTVKASVGLSEEAKRTKVKYGEGIVGWVAQNREPLLLVGKIKDPRFKPLIKREGIRSAICLPLKFENRIVGVLNVTNLKRERLYAESNLHVLMIIGDVAAIAMENARLFEEAERAYLSTIAALALAIEAKDPCTRGHCQAVASYAVAIAERLNLDGNETARLETAALLHDIGKIGIPEEILKKPGKLDESERNVVKLHPFTGVQIIEPVEHLSSVLPIIYHHHERYDGKGYIDGLIGEHIPMGSRILAVADSFDAMTSDRPYRNALSISEAIEELKRCSGNQFDPDVVNAFLEVLNELAIA
ncbi:MAG: HD domain-containing protein [Actinobacteria bacterium]|nr:HD domain-containing protein [Actinomycetota bacterium]